MELRNVAGVLNTLRALREDTTPAVELALQYLSEFGLLRAQAYAPVRTGFMRDNIQAYQEGDMQWIVISEAYYSFWVEYGHLTVAGTFVPGQFFFTHAYNDCQALIEDGGLVSVVAAELFSTA